MVIMTTITTAAQVRPQWSPVLETGNGTGPFPSVRVTDKPQWSPVLETGNGNAQEINESDISWPQWSPVLETGNGRVADFLGAVLGHAAMEPGLGDREWDGLLGAGVR